MILIVGGVGAGKRAFAVSALGLAQSDIAQACLDERPAVCDVQQLVGEREQDTLLRALLQKQVVICNEVGCGVVPVQAADRAWRENVGRLCCALADEASAVVRMCSGIPTVLKGSI